jgi:hypothetical protein
MVLETPISKIPEQNGLEVRLKNLELLLCKHEGLRSYSSPTKRRKKERKEKHILEVCLAFTPLENVRSQG